MNPRVLHFHEVLADRPRGILLARPMTIAEVVEKHQIDVHRRPTIAMIGGEAVLRGQWAVRLVRHDEVLSFIAMPGRGGGGSGKQIAGLIASLALVIAAPFVGGAVAGLFGLTSGMAGYSTVAGISSAAFLIGGRLLLNAVLPSQQTKNTSVPSVSAGSNQASPLDVVPVLYGNRRYAPRFAAAPYSEYQDNDQYLYQLLALTLGECAVKKIEIGDTPMWTPDGGVSDTWPDTEVQICAPGEAMTLFPANVETSSEVSGQTLPSAVDGAVQWLGPYVVNAAGTTIDKLAIDFACPSGLYKAGSSGSIKKVTVELDCQYRAVDDAGDPVGDGTWSTLYAEDLSMATRTPQRFTKAIDVPAGRYEVQFGRHDSQTDAGTDTVVWAGLRGYLRDFSLADGVTYLAIKIKANDRLSQQSASQINVTATRKLPIYDSGSGVWSAPQETQSIAWAAADICRNTDYAAGLADHQYDLAWLLSYDAVWAARGDTFNFVFDSKQSAEAALRTILRAGRAQPIRLGGMLGFLRDEPKTIRRAVWTPRNIVKGTFQEKIVLFDETSPDCVRVQYTSDNTWRSASVVCQAPGYSTDQPADLQLDGITDYHQAWREGVYAAASNAFRRRFFTFQAEWDGRILTKGDRVLVQHPILEANQSGAIVGLDGNTLTLDRDVTLDAGDNYLTIRTRTGFEWGYVKVTAGGDAHTLVMDAASRTEVETAMGALADQMPAENAEEAHFILFGQSGEEFSGLVVSCEPDDPDHITVTLVNDDPRVHTADQTQVVPTPPFGNPLPVIPLRPVIDASSLYASVQKGTLSYEVYVGYTPAVGASSYNAEISYDDGVTWQPIYSGTAVHWSASVTATAFKLRVQAIGAQAGPFVAISVDDLPSPQLVTDDIADGAIATNNILAEAVTELKLAADAVSAAKLQVAAVTSEVLADQAVLASKLADDAVSSNKIADDAVIASKIATGSIDATKFASGLTPVEIGGMLPTTGNFEGRQFYNTSDGTLYSYTSGAWTTFSVAPGSITATQISDGAVTTPKLAAGAVTADKIAANSITAGQIAAGAIGATQLAAGSISADKLTIGKATNRLENSDFTAGLARWVSGGTSANAIVNLQADNLYNVVGRPCLHIYQDEPGDDSGSYIDVQPINDNASAGFPVVPGGRYEISAYVNAHRCQTVLFARWLDGSGADMGVVSGYAPFAELNHAGDGTMGMFQRQFVFVDAPAGAAHILPYFRKLGTDAGYADSHAWFFECQLAEATVNQSEPSSWSPAGITFVTSDVIKTGAVIANKIAAGAVAADKLSVGTSGNMIMNSDLLSGSTANLQFGADNGMSTPFFGVDPVWHPTGMAACNMWYTGTPPVGVNAAYANILMSTASGGAQTYPVVAGQRYEWSAYASVHRCNFFVRLIFLDPAGNVVGDVSGNYCPDNEQGNTSLAYWSRSWVFATAPANASQCIPRIQMQTTGVAEPHVIFTGMYLGQANPNQTTPSDWTPAGVTTVDGSQVVTNSLYASKIVGGSITADKMGANSVTAGAIAAGAVTAEKIAAGAVTADKITVANLAALSAVLGNVDISNATVGTLKVGTSNIQPGAISNFGFGDGGNTGTASVTLDTTNAYMVLILGMCTASVVSGSGSAGFYDCTISRGVSELYSTSLSGLTNYKNSGCVIAVDTAPPGGNITYTVQQKGGATGGYGSTVSLETNATAIALRR